MPPLTSNSLKMDQTNAETASIPRPGASELSSQTDNATQSSPKDTKEDRQPGIQRPKKYVQSPSLENIDVGLRLQPLSRFMTERPMPTQKTSFLRMRRNQTGGTPASEESSDKTKSSDDFSSSDEDAPGMVSVPSRLSSQPSTIDQKRLSHSESTFKERLHKFSFFNEEHKTKCRISGRDGRLNISLKELSGQGHLMRTLGASLKQHPQVGNRNADTDGPAADPTPNVGSKREDRRRKLRKDPTETSLEEPTAPPSLNIVIMVIGSRGDIQPFLKIGKVLKENHGHRVRIATHPAFKTFIEQDSKLEFFSVGGDPAELMAFMVKNPGLIPSISTLKTGEVGRRRDAMFEMFQGFWRACVNAKDGTADEPLPRTMDHHHPFIADAIIANPPSFAHVHCAERLGIPLHLMFTFPYSPTRSFPHPLANIKRSNVDPNYANFMSYPLVEMMTWQGLGDLVNRFRVRTLGLEPVSTLWAPGQLVRQRVPYTYMWSPGLIPKPADWGPEIDIAGFVFLDLASSFKPPQSLAEFLEDGEPPVYIGFGSIVVDDPEKFTTLVFEAVEKAGVRALVSKGWGGLGHKDSTPDNIYMLENTPHDWLFPRCSAVVHHGGAGTTAIGLKCGKPTLIVPFFGDQPFWGAMVAKAGAGAKESIPYKNLTAETLATGIKQCLEPKAKAAAELLANSIADEGDGAKNAVESFHKHLPLMDSRSMRCSVLPDRTAVWCLKDTDLRLSSLAASLLVQEKKIKWSELKLLRHLDWNDFMGPGGPLLYGGVALVHTAGGVVKGIGGVPVSWARSIKRNREHEHGRKAHGNTQTLSTEGQRVEIETHEGENTLAHKGLLQEGNIRSRQVGKTSSDAKGKIAESVFGGSNDGNKASSPSLEHSDHHLALDLIEETGAGFVKTGESLAKGERSPRAFVSPPPS